MIASLKLIIVAGVCVLSACRKEPTPEDLPDPPDTTYQVRTVKYSFDYNPSMTVDVREGNLLDLAAGMMRTRNGILSAVLYPDSKIMEFKYRDDRMSEAGIVRELVTYFRAQHFNVHVKKIE